MQEKNASKLHPKPKLICADPPYNYGEPYDKYDDHKPWDHYIEWSHRWLTAAADRLDKHGSMFLFYPDELVSFIDVFCQMELGLHKRGHVIWHYTFGVCNSAMKNFSRSHAHILYYTKSKSVFTFNGLDVAVPSARSLVYNDKRANKKGKVPNDTWVLLKDQLEKVMLPDSDTWLESRICGTFKAKKKDSPNQLPLPLLQRIVTVASNPGELVYDPFNGSGTTGEAALGLLRNYSGDDLSERYIVNTKKRLDVALPGRIEYA
jgi:site-specific DNA-methyltransferase (adenine-specific)